LHAVAELTPQTRIPAQELKGRLTANEEFGFEHPQATIIFQQGSDSLTLTLGSLTMPGDQIYAQVVGLATVDIIDADFFKKLVPHQANDWRDTSFVNFTQYFDQLTVSSGSQLFELKRDGTNVNSVWHMIKPVQSRTDNARINLLLFVLQNMRITKFVNDDPKVDLEPFGLQPAALELKFDEGTNQLFSLQFGKSPTNDENQVYARFNGQNSIVLVPRNQVAPWTAGFQEFRDRHLVRLADGPPDVIEVTGAGKDENFTVQHQADDSWRVIKPLDLPADPKIMRAFLTNLTGIEVLRSDNRVAVDDTVPPDSPLYGLATPARRYILKRTNNSKNEIMAELDFGSAKDGHIFARRADLPQESSVYAVKLEDFQKLPATALQLRDRRIWDFSETNVSSITICQNGKNEQLVHKGPNKWTIGTGSGMINELEVEVAAQELGFLAADNWIQRGDTDRERYGFTNKLLQISVDLKEGDRPKTLTVYLGGVAPNGLRYGDTQLDDGLNWIFEFQPKFLDELNAYLNIHENPGP
jgi:hypothetical protein